MLPLLPNLSLCSFSLQVWEMTRKINFISQFFLGRLTVPPFESHPTHRRRRRTFSLLIQLTSRGSEKIVRAYFVFEKFTTFDGGGQTCELKRKTPKWNHFIILHKFSSDCFVSCVSEQREKEKQSKKWNKLFPCNFNFFSLFHWSCETSCWSLPNCEGMSSQVQTANLCCLPTDFN